MKKMRYFCQTCIACILMLLLAVSCNDSDESNASALASRLLGERASEFVFSKSADSSDVFTISSRGGKILIEAPEVNSMATGLGYYLRNICHTDVSWYLEDAVELPDVLPVVETPIRVEARVDDRFFLNYCTFGYSLPWWNWEQWERLIDWMAVNGVTKPLAITGQEAVWQKVWHQYGMSDEQIRGFFTGPAVLPWHRMMNVDSWLSPLPQSWIDAQADLQKKIVARERALGMTPVLSAFSGHIPVQMKEILPDADIRPVSLWDGFGPECRTYILHPDDKNFAQIQKRFLKEQKKMFGTDHIYGLDIFNEVDFFEGQEWDPQELSRISHHVYETLAAADPNAVWLQMGWMMYYDSKHWTPENINAYLGSVPQGKVIMLDYFCEKSMIWETTDSFYGQPYYLCFLGNFGGNTLLEGNFDDLGPRIEKTLAKGGDNLAGLGCTLEGFGVTQFLYEYTLEKAWATGLGDEQFIENLADRRGGKGNPELREAWKTLCHEVYSQCATSSINSSACRHPHLDRSVEYPTHPYKFYEPAVLEQVFEQMVNSGVKDSPAFDFDLISVGTKVLEDRFEKVVDDFFAAYGRKDIASMEEASQNMNMLYLQMERLTATSHAFSLRKWIEEARSWGADAEEADYFETSARTMLSSWGGAGQLTDYAARQWNGMFTNYYGARWSMFCNWLIYSVDNGTPFDQEAYDKAVREYELAFGQAGNPLRWKGDSSVSTIEVAKEIL